MNQARPWQSDNLPLEHKVGRRLGSEDPMDAVDYEEMHLLGPDWNESTNGSEGLTGSETQWMPWNNLLSQLQQGALTQRSAMTVAEFVERKFIPEHVALKESSGKTHYQAMLKHVLTPAEVDRVFGVHPMKPGKKLKALPDWPYMSNVRLCDARPEHVQRLTSAALERGYATQTVVHLRNVVSAIFSHAKREGCFTGDNPATSVKPPEITRRESGVLTMAQVKDALAVMKYPEKEMMLMVIFIDMNVSEICGLQWKRVNLTDATLNVDGEMIPPGTIAIRKQWNRGVMGSVKTNRIRNLPIPKQLISVLNRIRANSRFTRDDDFVFVSRVGTPVNETNIRTHVLPTIARQLGITSLSWRVFLRTRQALLSEFETQAHTAIAYFVGSASPRDAGTEHKWRCRDHAGAPHLRWRQN
jgi:integrase